MNCETVYMHIEDYFDSMLDPKQIREISDHLESCDSCRNRLLAESRFRTVIRNGLLETRPGDDIVWQRVLAALPGERRPRRKTQARPYVFMAAAIVLLVVGTLWYRHASRASSLADLMMADYREYVSGEMNLSLQSSEFSDVSRFFESQLGVRIDQCRTNDEQCRLVGGRTCYLNQVPTALLVFHQASNPVSVFILPASELHRFPQTSMMREGETWKGSAGGLAVVGRPAGNQLVYAIGETEPLALERLVESLCVN